MARSRQPLSGAVLTGGASRRMGTDKALLQLAESTMLQRVLAVVGAVADDVAIIGDRAPYHGLGVPVFADAYPGTGTLGGIATALHHAGHSHVLVVACDMPLLSQSLLEAMADIPRDYDVLIPATDAARSDQQGEVTYETLHAIYHRRCLPGIERRIAAGQLKVADALQSLNVRVLPESWLRELDPELDSLMNVNRPADLEIVRRRLEDDSSLLEDGS